MCPWYWWETSLIWKKTARSRELAPSTSPSSGEVSHTTKRARDEGQTWTKSLWICVDKSSRKTAGNTLRKGNVQKNVLIADDPSVRFYSGVTARYHRFPFSIPHICFPYREVLEAFARSANALPSCSNLCSLNVHPGAPRSCTCSMCGATASGIVPAIIQPPCCLCSKAGLPASTIRELFSYSVFQCHPANHTLKRMQLRRSTARPGSPMKRDRGRSPVSHRLPLSLDYAPRQSTFSGLHRVRADFCLSR